MRKSARLAAKGPQERPKLPADVLSEILLLLESFEDLGRAILSHSSFYDAFRAHRRAVLQHVARNLAGPDVDDAFGLVKDLAVHALVSSVGKSKEAVKQNRERLVMPADAEMSAADARELRRIFEVVDEWERIFELLVKDPQARRVYAFLVTLCRCADRRRAGCSHRPALYYRAFPPRPTCRYVSPGTSVDLSSRTCARMTHSERTRFRRAVLRFWRYCVQSEAMIQNYDALKAVRPMVEHCSKIFHSLSPLEAAEFMAVIDVAKQLVQNVFTWNLDGDDGFSEQRQRVTGSLTDDGALVDFQSALVSSGPGALHDAWKVRSFFTALTGHSLEDQLFTIRSCTDQRFLDKLDLISSKAGGGSREGGAAHLLPPSALAGRKSDGSRHDRVRVLIQPPIFRGR
jgi:hypothetical protein